MKIRALITALLFSFWVWCTGFAESKLPTLTSQNSFQSDCLDARLISTSPRTEGPTKDGQVSTIGDLPASLSKEVLISGYKITSASQIICLAKVPIYLINPVLTI